MYGSQLISLTEARAYVLERVYPLPPRVVPLREALGCVLTCAIDATSAVPGFDNSAVDGYALRSDDTTGAPCELRVVGVRIAGSPEPVRVGPREALRIMTGAPLPEGADAAVMVEHTTLDSDLVRVAKSAPLGDNIRRAGEDIAIGQRVFEPLTQLHAAHLGVLASLGYREVLASARPRVGVMTTGDELIDTDVELQPGQIRDSNRVMLLGLLRASGFHGIDLGLVRDDERALTARLGRAAAECDAVLVTGGISMGDRDLVKVVVDRLSRSTPASTGAMRWMQIAIKPAKPFAFGLLGSSATPVFALPGNPVAALVSFEVLARPALRALAGHPSDRLERPAIRAIADEDLRRRADGKLHLVRVRTRWADDGRLHVAPVAGQQSHQLAATAQASGLVELPDGNDTLAGADVIVRLLD